jgi:hypothetical protein
VTFCTWDFVGCVKCFPREARKQIGGLSVFRAREAWKTEIKGLKMIILAFGGNSDHNFGFRDLTNPSQGRRWARGRAGAPLELLLRVVASPPYPQV